MSDSEAYKARKSFFQNMLTIYGRKPVLEALQDPQIEPFRLHLAEKNKPNSQLRELTEMAQQKGAELQHHSRDALSRISKNRRQDQGVVLDIKAPKYQPISKLLDEPHAELIAVENVTNPQNLGMIIRSVAASPAAGVIIPRTGCASLDGLVIKASAGSLFHTPIFYCDELLSEVDALKSAGYRLIGLAGEGNTSIKDLSDQAPTIFCVGNESEGLSAPFKAKCHDLVHIPMSHGVESLNVGVAAALIAFRSMYR